MKKLVCMMVLMAFASAAQANFVTNGDFAEGFAGWGYGGTTYTENWVDEGKQGLTGTNINIWQNTHTPIEADTVYTMFVVARAAPARPGVLLKIEDSSAGWARILDEEFYFPTEDLDDQNGPWREFTMSFNTADAAYADFVGGTIAVGVEALGDSSWLHIDSVTLIPEPATVALLSLGGLVLLKKRRS